MSDNDILARAGITPQSLAYSLPGALANYASNGTWQYAPHLKALEDKLLEVASGKCKRLLVSMPPRSGKSMLISQYFPAWFLGRYPDKNIILASYEANFSASWGRLARNILEEHGQSIFGVEIAQDSAASDHWSIKNHIGGMHTAGAGGSLTGRGGDVIILDDVVKNDKEALSSTIQNGIWNWFQCFTPDTDILTNNGWKNITEITTKDIAATVDPITHELHYEKVSHTHKYPYSGKIYDFFQKNGVSFSVTPNHNVYYKGKWGTPEFRPCRADNLPLCGEIMKSPKFWKGNKPPDTITFDTDFHLTNKYTFDFGDWLEFLGVYLGDGHTNGNSLGISIVMPKQRIVFEKLLNKMGLKYKYCDTNRYYRIHSAPIAQYTKKLGVAHNKYIPRDILEYDMSSLKRIFDGLMFSDGCKIKQDRLRYSYVTSSPQLANDVEELCVKLGYGVNTTITSKDTYRKPCYIKGHIINKNYDSYKVNIRPESRVVYFNRTTGGNNKTRPVYETKDYSGDVYCVTVPPHNTLVIKHRQRISISGNSTVYTRQAPNAAIIILMTRWAKEDLVGKLIDEMKSDPDAEQWEVLNFPAIAEENNDILGRNIGEALWPERFPIKVLEKYKKTMGVYWFSSLYQGRPQSLEGNMIKMSWFQRYKEPPANPTAIYLSLDTATKDKEINDYSVIITACEYNNNLYILDVKRDKYVFPRLLQVTKNIILSKKPNAVIIEDKASGSQLIQMLRDGDVVAPVVAVTPSVDKATRMMNESPLIESGRVFLPETADWLMDFEDEIRSFPQSLRKDQVDATSQLLKIWREKMCCAIDIW